MILGYGAARPRFLARAATPRHGTVVTRAIIATADRPRPRCLTVLRKQNNAQTNCAAPELG